MDLLGEAEDSVLPLIVSDESEHDHERKQDERRIGGG